MDEATQTSWSARFAALLERRRALLLALWTAHAFLLHRFVIGFVSWDGLAYRVPPAIEVVQHGAYGFDKFNQWAFTGYVPFLELIHVPFLFVFKMPGLFLGFPLIVFPLCVVGIFAFVRELTGDARSATFGALAYGAIPMINQQPYSGYVDFIVCALLAFVLYAILRVGAVVGVPAPRRATRPLGDRPLFVVVQLAVATTLFTMSRMQGLYALGLLFPVVAYTRFCERSGLRLRLSNRCGLVAAVAATAIGAVPTLAVQIAKYARHGTPTYPFQLQILGMKFGKGVSMQELFSYGGLRDETPIEFARAFLGSWVWPRDWPLGSFYDSRNMGGGFVLIVAVVLLPFFLRAARRSELLVVGACVMTSLVARDFWLPRYAYTLVVALAIVIGRGMSFASTAPSARPAYWFAAVLLLAHLARPEFDVVMLETLHIGPRVNLAASALFPHARWEVYMFPDNHSKFVIIEAPRDRFLVPLYGRGLTNEVVKTIPGAQLGERCANLAPTLEADPSVLFIDDDDRTTGCDRTCAMTFDWGCRAWQIRPPPVTTTAPTD